MLLNFPCGCQIQTEEFDINEINTDCSATWSILAEGYTKGIFQLESNLGKHWCKKLKPVSLEHMCALGSILRPGSLNANDENGVSATKHYCLRKNGEEEVEKVIDEYDDVVKETYGCLIYQEQIMELSRILAGFSPILVDKLRKSIGKKDVKELFELKEKFVNGCVKVGKVSKELAEKIWGWIKESGRYCFNKSHAYSYGLTGYQTAYIKAHFPISFYWSWLLHADKKQDPQEEMRALIEEAKLFGIEVKTPNIIYKEEKFHAKDKTIFFGLGNIKGLGLAQIKKLVSVINDQEEKRGKNIKDFKWIEFLIYITPLLSKTVVENLISVGALCDISDKTRKEMLFEYSVLLSLTDKEVEFLSYKINEKDELLPLLIKYGNKKKDGGMCAHVSRINNISSCINLIRNPPTSHNDSPAWIASNEERLLGLSISSSRVDSFDLSCVNCTCSEFLAGKTGNNLLLGVEIVEFREHKTKNGNNPGSLMCFLKVKDATAQIDDVVIFPQVYAESKEVLYQGSIIAINGIRDKKEDKNKQLIVNKVWKLER